MGRGGDRTSSIVLRLPFHPYTPTTHQPHQESLPFPPYTGNATRECFYQRSSAAATTSTAGACMRRDSCFILRAPSRNCIARTAAAWWIATRRHFRRRRRLVDPPPDRFSLIGNISRDRFLPLTSPPQSPPFNQPPHIY